MFGPEKSITFQFFHQNINQTIFVSINFSHGKVQMYKLKPAIALNSII